MKKRDLKIRFILLILFLLIFALFTLRLILPRQLDDVSPEISCSEELLERADVFYVIPKFNGIPINENPEWCQKILSYEKEIALHGFEHTYEEFGSELKEEELTEGIRIFEDCFGFKPERFKPPQIALSNENKKMIQKFLNLDYRFNQILHKVYHCNDTGWPKNKFNEFV